MGMRLRLRLRLRLHQPSPQTKKQLTGGKFNGMYLSTLIRPLTSPSLIPRTQSDNREFNEH